MTDDGFLDGSGSISSSIAKLLSECGNGENQWRKAWKAGLPYVSLYKLLLWKL